MRQLVGSAALELGLELKVKPGFCDLRWVPAYAPSIRSVLTEEHLSAFAIVRYSLAASHVNVGESSLSLETIGG